jgi:hypothetical protein
MKENNVYTKDLLLFLVDEEIIDYEKKAGYIWKRK